MALLLTSSPLNRVRQFRVEHGHNINSDSAESTQSLLAPRRPLCTTSEPGTASGRTPFPLSPTYFAQLDRATPRHPGSRDLRDVINLTTTQATKQPKQPKQTGDPCQHQVLGLGSRHEEQHCGLLRTDLTNRQTLRASLFAKLSRKQEALTTRPTWGLSLPPGAVEHQW